MRKNEKANFFLRLAVMACTGFFFFPALQDAKYSIQNRYTTRALLSRVGDYLSVSRDSSTIYYTEADAELIPLIQRTIDLYYPLMAKDFQINEPPAPTVILYPDGETLINNTNNSQLQAPMGVYYGGIIHILSPRVWVLGTNDVDVLEIFLEQGPLVHEIAHYLTDLKTEGKYEVWLTEGVALYYEYKYTAYEWRKDLKEEAGMLTFEELSGHFNQLNQGVAYRKAFDLVNGLVEREGEDALQNLIGVSFPIARFSEGFSNP